MKKNKLFKVICPICGPAPSTVLFPANFDDQDISIETFSARRLPDKIHYQLLTCNRCGLVRSSPVLPESTLEKLYRKSTFTYEQEVIPLTKSYMNAVLPVCKKLSKHANILEIGCGNGFMLEALLLEGYKNVYGIEPSSHAVRQAKTKIKKRISVNMLKPGVFPKKKFDFIFFLQTFDHIADPVAFLRICKKMMKPGGYILTFNHNVGSYSARLLKEKSPIFDIEHTFLYDPSTMTKIFNEVGFQVEKVYSPKNSVTLRHLFWLLPFPKKLKCFIKSKSWKFLSFTLQLELGNICLVARRN